MRLFVMCLRSCYSLFAMVGVQQLGAFFGWEIISFTIGLLGAVAVGFVLAVIASLIRPMRRYLLLIFLALPSAYNFWVWVNWDLLDYACGDGAAYGPDHYQSFKYCSSAWPEHAVFPLWILSTAICWGITLLAQRWLNRRSIFFGGKSLSEETSQVTTLGL